MTSEKAAVIRGYRSMLALIADRPLYIWGAGNQGRGLCRVLEKQGMHLSGFIDSSAVVRNCRAVGYEVFSPEQVLHARGRATPFVIIASFFHERDIAARCIEAGLVEGVDFVPYTAIKPFDYAIDISGVCNLRCISCPRSDRTSRRPPEGFMSPETFGRVLDKILDEDPLAGSVQLYQWGEPLLNPHIAEIIGYAAGRGVQCAISSNLNDDRNLASAVKAGPAWFRISVSGCGKNYETTHTGGSWERFLRNFTTLAELRRLYNPDMKTEVYYHLYKHNQGEDIAAVRNLCENSGFEFHPVYAYLISLDDVLKHCEGAPLPKSARKAEGMLALDLDEGMKRARAEADKDCLTLRCVYVNWNLAVSNCMMFFYPDDNVAAENFLETPLSTIAERRRSCSLCRRCKRQALHRYCSVYSTTPTPRAAPS
jgi:MoaA/NifB/PqqE/SkfB family radical SAM enzyme